MPTPEGIILRSWGECSSVEIRAGADLSGCDLIGQDFTGWNFRGVNLALADMRDTDLTRAQFDAGTDLRGVRFGRCHNGRGFLR